MAGYVKQVTIKNVTVKYKPTVNNFKQPPDIWLDVEYEIDQGWDDKVSIFGNIKEDLPHTDPKSWHSAFKVRNFFEKALETKNLQLNADYTIPEEWVSDAIGRKIKVISYPTTKTKQSGKPFWNTFNIVYGRDQSDAYIKEELQKQVNDGWIRNYKAPDSQNNSTTQSGEPNAVKSASLEDVLDL